MSFSSSMYDLERSGFSPKHSSVSLGNSIDRAGINLMIEELIRSIEEHRYHACDGTKQLLLQGGGLFTPLEKEVYVETTALGVIPENSDFDQIDPPVVSFIRVAGVGEKHLICGEERSCLLALFEGEQSAVECVKKRFAAYFYHFLLTKKIRSAFVSVFDLLKGKVGPNKKWMATCCFIDKSKNIMYTATLGTSEANIYRNIDGKMMSIPLSYLGRNCVEPRPLVNAYEQWSKRTRVSTNVSIQAPNVESQDSKKIFNNLIELRLAMQNQKKTERINQLYITVVKIKEGDRITLVPEGVKSTLAENAIRDLFAEGNFSDLERYANQLKEGSRIWGLQEDPTIIVAQVVSNDMSQPNERIQHYRNSFNQSVTPNSLKKMLRNAGKAINEHIDNARDSAVVFLRKEEFGSWSPREREVYANEMMPTVLLNAEEFNRCQEEDFKITPMVRWFTQQGKYKKVNEDCYFITQEEQGILLGVLDGHGGDVVSGVVREKFKGLFFTNLLANLDIREVFIETFAEMEEIVKIHTSGCTAVICFIDTKKGLIYTATLGDSEANIYRNIDGERIVSIPLSCVRDWTCKKDALRAKEQNKEIEPDKIRSFQLNNKTPETLAAVCLKPRVDGINVSRAFGDGKRSYMGKKPKIVVSRLRQEDVILVTSDGVGNFVPANEIVSILRNISISRKKFNEFCRKQDEDFRKIKQERERGFFLDESIDECIKRFHAQKLEEFTALNLRQSLFRNKINEIHREQMDSILQNKRYEGFRECKTDDINEAFEIGKYALNQRFSDDDITILMVRFDQRS